LALAGTAECALAATAGELFADGNRLFRDDLYWAALLRYREAAEAGMETPLLHYNTGIAHYKAQQYVRARESLQKASTYGPLAPLSHYNLGLTAYRQGDYDAALHWLRQAARQKQRPDIAKLARRAIRLLEKNRKAEGPVMVQSVVRKRERKLTTLDFKVRSGTGFDDNVYRTPANPYTDVSNPNNPVLVTPNVQSGFYVPFSLNARYRVNTFEHEAFFGSYRFGGRFYQDQDLQNGDEYLHEVAFGSEYRKRSEDRETRVYSAFKIAQHEEDYYDPDDGLDRIVGGVNISNRLSYLRYGPEFWARKTIGRYSFGIRAKGQLWNYDKVTAVSEYDNEYLLAGLNSHIRLSPTSLLRLNADYSTRRYGDRPAFELDGTQPLGNPGVSYDYLDLGVEARQRITDVIWFGIGYTRTDRKDNHVGYNDYTRDRYSVRFNLRLGKRFRLEARARFDNYNYDNAFAFHEPTAGRKTMERTIADIVMSYEMSETLDLIAEYHYRDVVSSDARLDYTRGQAIIAVRWSP